MTRSGPVLKLQEQKRSRFPVEAFSHNVVETLWHTYGDKLAIEFPSPKTGGQWELVPQGWIGYIPVSENLTLALQPKVPIENLFGMLEYAYTLRSFLVSDDLSACESFEEFYEEIARILTSRILARHKKGLYREYIDQADRLSYLRGKLNVAEQLRTPWNAYLSCNYQEHSQDVIENHILLWTLRAILGSTLCSERIRPLVRAAFRTVRHGVTLVACEARDCWSRTYNRLNRDYQALHTMCRFFLENSGPTHRVGNKDTFSFLLNMPQLFELFVAEWLAASIGAVYHVQSQERIGEKSNTAVSFQPDIVIRERQSRNPLCVLDTKYKAPESPSADDVAQVIAYAEILGCKRAYLVYPHRLVRPVDGVFGEIRVQTVTFGIEGDLEEAGIRLLDDLGLLRAG